MEKYANLYANINLLQKQLLTGNRMTVLQILENSQENNRNGVQYQYIYRPCGFIKKCPATDTFVKTFRNLQNKYFYVTPLDVTSQFIDNSYSSCPLVPALIACREKREKTVDQDFMLEVLLANKALRI